MNVDQIQQRFAGLFPSTLGIRLTRAEAGRVEAELAIRDDLCTVPGVAHGGALMAFADTLGAVATVLNLPAGATTTTLESKTNFLRAGRAGSTLRGECTPIHRGGATMVWQTRILDSEKLVALVTQTQMVLLPREPRSA
ncbi:MAG TPA: PaaI family thioesterase [Thermoanaerobaculia bacterium]|nr:PaaI family thioesterase [Thermoanaerobaculia bacterium]